MHLGQSVLMAFLALHQMYCECNYSLMHKRYWLCGERHEEQGHRGNDLTPGINSDYFFVMKGVYRKR